MRLVLLAFPGNSYAGSHPETRRRWFVGEERDLSDDTAAYLLSSFPDHFALVADAPLDPSAEPEGALPEPVEGHASAPSEPSADRAVRSPRRRRG